MNPNIFTSWTEIGAEWPDPIQLRRLKHLPGFPYSAGYIRNLCSGADPALRKHIFYIGKFPAIRKAKLIEWLDRRTEEASK